MKNLANFWNFSFNIFFKQKNKDLKMNLEFYKNKGWYILNIIHQIFLKQVFLNLKFGLCSLIVFCETF